MSNQNNTAFFPTTIPAAATKDATAPLTTESKSIPDSNNNNSGSTLSYIDAYPRLFPPSRCDHYAYAKKLEAAVKHGRLGNDGESGGWCHLELKDEESDIDIYFNVESETLTDAYGKQKTVVVVSVVPANDLIETPADAAAIETFFNFQLFWSPKHGLVSNDMLSVHGCCLASVQLASTTPSIGAESNQMYTESLPDRNIELPRRLNIGSLFLIKFMVSTFYKNA